MIETKLEHILTNSYKAGMIAYMESHPEDFEEAIKLAVADKHPYSWRAAWILWSCMDDNDPRISKYLDEIIDSLPKKSDNQLRELLKILQRMELNDDCEGKLFDICVDIWEKIGKQPSVRCSALKMIIKIIKKHPEMSDEILFLTAPHYTDSLSEAFKKSISKMTDGLNINR